ncbi:MAG: phosphatidylglycerophosphatase A family protein, partial [Rhodanobacteraceae bacterium]
MKTLLTEAQRRALLTHPDGWIATGLGAGLFPKAPGTFGSLVALLPWWFLLRHLPVAWYVIVLIVAFVVGVWSCEMAGKRLAVDDHRALVWDEFVGQWLALCAAPFGWPR